MAVPRVSSFLSLLLLLLLPAGAAAATKRLTCRFATARQSRDRFIRTMPAEVEDEEEEEHRVAARARSFAVTTAMTLQHSPAKDFACSE